MGTITRKNKSRRLLIGLGLALSLSPEIVALPSYSDVKLQIEYAFLNKRDFGNKLPMDTYVHYGNYTDHQMDGDIGWTIKRQDGTFEIAIDEKTNPTWRQTDLTLIHEMCHVKTWDYVRAHNEDVHGHAFQACMMEQAMSGHLEDLW